MSHPVTRRHHIRRWFDPRDPYGMDPGHYALVLLLGIAIGLALYFATERGIEYGRAYFAHRYVANVPVPKKAEKLPVIPHAALYPPSATIQLAHYPGVGDQDGIGSCAAWATAWALSYEFRMLHLDTHPGIKFSPKAMYDHYVSVYGGGQDSGSWWPQDAEIAQTTGLPQFKRDPYPPYLLGDGSGNFALSSDAATNAAHFRFQVQTQTLSYSMGGGPGAVDAIKSGIVQGYPMLLALPVYPEFDNATQTGGIIPTPRPDEPIRGGHGIVVIGYDDSRQAVLIQNQWSTAWGDHGRAWLSYGYVEQFGFGISQITIGGAVSAAYFPGGQAYGLRNIKWLVSSPFWYENGVVGGHVAVADTDYILGYAAHQDVRLPGSRKHSHWRLTQQAYIPGSGWYETFKPARHRGHVAFLHLYRMLHRPLGSVFRGKAWVGVSGWPSSFEFSNGFCNDWVTCEADAHLCVVTDYWGSLWLYHLTTGRRVSALPASSAPTILPYPWVPPSGKAPPHAPPKLPPSVQVPAHPGYWVRHVKTADTGKDITKLINQAGRQYHLWPMGIAAMLGTESNFHQYAPRYGQGCDVSFGLTQVTVCSAGVYGLGDGSLTPVNIAYVRSVEEQPRYAVPLAARMLNDMRRICGWTFSPLYACYNRGPFLGYRNAWYTSPTGTTAQAYSNFKGWLRYAQIKFR